MTLQFPCGLKYFKAAFYFFSLYQTVLWQILLLMALQTWPPDLKSWEIKTSSQSRSHTGSSWSLSLILVKKGHRILSFKGWQLWDASNFILCGFSLACSQPHAMPHRCLFQDFLQSSFLPPLLSVLWGQPLYGKLINSIIEHSWEFSVLEIRQSSYLNGLIHAAYRRVMCPV